MLFIVFSFKVLLASTEFISVLPAKHGVFCFFCFLKKERKKKPKMLLSKNIISCLILLLFFFFFWNSLAYAQQPRLPNRFLSFPHLSSHITFSFFQSDSGQNAAMPVTHASGWSLSSLPLALQTTPHRTLLPQGPLLPLSLNRVCSVKGSRQHIEGLR